MTAKLAQDYIPPLKEQGIPTIVGAAKAGLSVQALRVAMPAGGVIVFEDNGLVNMADGEYLVFVANSTDILDPGHVLWADRLATQFTVTGPDADDELDILVIGQLAGQQA